MTKPLDSAVNRNFFQTSEGRPHLLRIAGLLYVISLVLGCRGFHLLEPGCLGQIMFVTGWWLSFCGKRVRSLSDPIVMTGIVLIGLGLAGQIYSTCVSARVLTGFQQLLSGVRFDLNV